MKHILDYPFDHDIVTRKKKSLKKELLQGSNFIDKKIAILGGSTTSEVKDILELFLLKEGIRPEFYESEYNKYYEDIMFSNPILENFNPDLIYIHTTIMNIDTFPSMTDSQEQVDLKIKDIVSKFKEIWDTAVMKYKAPIIQNNFELPYYRILGNLDASDIHGKVHFVNMLNLAFAKHARENQNLYLNDINYLSSWYGLDKWYDRFYWHSYKYAMGYAVIPYLSHQLSSLIAAIYGKSKKCLALDLDNTLWGGVIGDDGLTGIKIGKETPTGEAYTEFQKYVKELKERGVILSVCSKNEDKNAREGFTHPDSVLKIDDFTSFIANWNQKSDNVQNIAKQINIGMQSIVFVDDNPAERELVKTNCPEVSVPDIGDNIVKFINIIDKAGYFETTVISSDDLNRETYYKDNVAREDFQSGFSSYDEFLDSLDMMAEIDSFKPVYLERITQLTNKTNQFNLTTKRYTASEMYEIYNDPTYIKLYGKMQDKFGDNGLISIIIGRIDGIEMHIDLWLMSCRVIKREMELAMFDALVKKCIERGVETIIGYYYPTAKNDMVSHLLDMLGFVLVSQSNSGNSIWNYKIPVNFVEKNKFIKWSSANDPK